MALATVKQLREKFIFSVSIAEFDITTGNTLSVKHPDFKLKYDDEYLANTCLPDGAHIHKEDWVYLTLEFEDDDGKPFFLYGLGFFRNVRDPSVPRGAIQKSMLILSYQPYFSIFLPLCRAALTRYMDTNDKNVLKQLYTALNTNVNKQMQINLWGEDFPLNIPVVKEDQYAGISLVELVKIFKEQTMILWYSMLLQYRVLFVGQPAHSVCNACLACPLLVAPLVGFTKLMTPYVSLTHTDPMDKPTYVCGTTNQIFEAKTQIYDVMGSFNTANVLTQMPVRVSGSDLSHIRSVITGIADNKGEQWVREQFRLYTVKFLKNLENNRLSGQHRKLLSTFRDSQYYVRYAQEKRAAMSNQGEQKGAIDFLKTLQDQEEIGVLEKTKTFYELHKHLENITSIEEVCDAGGVPVVATSLGESSAQVRKYSAQVLSQLALSVKGQIAILSSPVLDRILEMLRDPMPNVANAAAYCLQKISTLFIGVDALCKRGITQVLSDVICSTSENLVLKKSAAATLLQIYRWKPETPPLDASLFQEQLKSPDRVYTITIVQLLDSWSCAVPKIPISQSVSQVLTSLGDTDVSTRSQATSFLLSNLVSQPELVLEFVEGGGIELVVYNESVKGSDHKLSRLSFSVLALVADFHVGRAKLISLRVIERAVQQLGAADFALYLFAVARFLEVICQHSETSEHFYALGGAQVLVDFVAKYHDQHLVNTICLPALGALRYMAITLGDKKPALTEPFSTLANILVDPAARDPENPAHEPNFQEALNATLAMVALGIDMGGPAYTGSTTSSPISSSLRSEATSASAAAGPPSRPPPRQPPPIPGMGGPAMAPVIGQLNSALSGKASLGRRAGAEASQSLE